MIKLSKNLKVNDCVVVLSGKFRKQTGQVLSFNRKLNLVTIKDLNLKFRMVRKMDPQTGKFVRVMLKMPGGIHLSKVKFVSRSTADSEGSTNE